MKGCDVQLAGVGPLPAGQIGGELRGRRPQARLTNAVKHFKFEPRGKRLLHKRPNASEVKILSWLRTYETGEFRWLGG